ncbi:MAG: hypothetical protein ACR2HY_00505 [Acidimicrobiales bacterium]
MRRLSWSRSAVGLMPSAVAGSFWPARDQRIQYLLGATIVLFLAAVAQTLWLWLRRRARPDVVGGLPEDLIVIRPEPPGATATRWYSPGPTQLSDLPPPLRGPVEPAQAVDGVDVPDLLSVGPEDGVGGLDPYPDPWVDEPVPQPVYEASSLAPVDISEPDLWGPTDAEPAPDDSQWDDLLVEPRPSLATPDPTPFWEVAAADDQAPGAGAAPPEIKDADSWKPPTDPYGSDEIARQEVEAGLASLVAEIGVVAAERLVDQPSDNPPAEDQPLDAPAVDALAGELSIDDLLSEELPIPESHSNELSIRELLSEDLVVPEEPPMPTDRPDGNEH